MVPRTIDPSKRAFKNGQTVRFSREVHEQAFMLCRALGLTFSELVERAVRNEIAAAEKAPTVKNAIDVLRGLDESMRRRLAIREGTE